MLVNHEFTHLENNAYFLKEVLDATDNVADTAKNRISSIWQSNLILTIFWDY